jgi:membrane protease YdiL (CAAX protease family)
MIYRGFLFTALAQSSLRFWGAALLSSIIFGLSHTQYSAATQIEMMAVGIAFCWAVRKTGSLWPSLIAHILWNSTVGLAKMFL